jgi:uncharacterized membrane protein
MPATLRLVAGGRGSVLSDESLTADPGAATVTSSTGQAGELSALPVLPVPPDEEPTLATDAEFTASLLGGGARPLRVGILRAGVSRREPAMNDRNRKLVAASFSTPDGGSRAGGAIAGAFPDKVGNTAVLHVRPDGKPKFVESRDWGAGRGALLGGVIGIIGGPIGIVAGGGIGALAAKLRDSGFKNDQLEQLGRSLGPGHSAVVVEIGADAVDAAEAIARTLGAAEVVSEDVDASVAGLFEGEAEPEAEADPEAVPAAAG